MKKKGPHYHVPIMQDMNHLIELATAAIEAAREGAPDQHETATRLYEGICGPTRRSSQGGG